MKGYFYALTAALLFGVSTPFAKELLNQLGGVLLAGILYLGSGTGLLLLILGRRIFAKNKGREIRFNVSEWLWLFAGVLIGGVLAPMLLLAGLNRTSATAGSLLLNFEAAFTALLAWWLFRERISPQVAAGIALITLGGLLLGGPNLANLQFDIAAPFIAGACLCWAIDNNLIRKVSRGDALKVAAMRGLLAGAINITVASAVGQLWPQVPLLLQATFLGFVSYGLGLAFFIVALRQLGAARAGANFAVAPFIGAAVAIVWLGEAPTLWTASSALLMAAGLWLLLLEQRQHRVT